MGETVDAVGGRSELSFEPPADLAGATPTEFPPEKCGGEGMEEGARSGSVELSLGLSLNGRFGVDPASRKRERRSRPSAAAAMAACAMGEECVKRKVGEKRKGIVRRRRLEEGVDKSEGAGESSLVSDSLVIVEADTDSIRGVQKKKKYSSKIDRRKRDGERPCLGGGEEGVDMPSVSAIGDGPNGRRVEGFLCKYGKGEEVRIVCVCHGTSLSPSQFVQHAGALDLDNPLRRIVVRTDNQLPFSVNGVKNSLFSSDRCY